MVRPDGAPAGGVLVVLSRETSVGELFGGFFLASLTLFTACLADPPPAPCRSGLHRAVTTGADGAAAFTLTGKDTQTAFGTASTFSVAARLPSASGQQAGPVATYRLKVQTEHLILPDLRLWEPAVRLSAAEATWDALPSSGYGEGAGYRLLFEDTAGTSVWSFDASGTDLRFDPRVLEDSRGGATVVARRKLTATGTSVDALYGSARLAFAGSAGAPVSRGAPCSLQTGTQPAAAVSPCALTDGDFARAIGGGGAGAVAGSDTTAPPPTAAIVDLGRSRNVSLVVVRGCACSVDTSVDGIIWVPLGDLSTADSSLQPPRPTAARFVRVHSTSGVTGLREVSVWDNQPSTAGASATGAATGSAAAGSTASGAAASTRTSSRLVWAVAALIAIALVVGGVAVAFVRRPAR